MNVEDFTSASQINNNITIYKYVIAYTPYVYVQPLILIKTDSIMQCYIYILYVLHTYHDPPHIYTYMTVMQRN